MLAQVLVLALPVAACSSSSISRGQEKIQDLIFQQPNLIYTHMFLASNCSKDILSTQSQRQSTGGLTIFAPDDAAWNSTFNMKNFSGFNNCTGSPRDLSMCMQLFAQNFSRCSPNDLGDCLSILASHMAVSGTHPNLIMLPEEKSTVNVLQTRLNNPISGSNTRLNSTSSLIVTNQASSHSAVRGGGNSTAVIVDSLNATDGQVYIVDNILLPPLSLNDTLGYFNISLPASVNATLEEIQNQAVSIFMPFELLMQNQTGNASSFSLSSYIIPQAVYLNQSQAGTLDYTALDGSPLKTDVSNKSLTLNGSQPLSFGNIPFANGMLFLTNGTLSATSSTSNNSTSRRAGATQGIRVHRA